MEKSHPRLRSFRAMQSKKTFSMGGVEGYLTVFLSLILSVMISLCLVLIYGVRENTRRLEIECVTDIGMNNILAEYHRELLVQYDLFFIDTSYGTALTSYEQTEEHLKNYLEMNLGGDEIFLSALYRDLLKLQPDNVEITEVSVASDDEGAVLRRQAVDVMLARVGADVLKQVQNWFTVVEDYELDNRDVVQEQKEAAEQLTEWNGTTVLVNGVQTEVAIDAPGADIAAAIDEGILSLVVEKPEELSQQGTNIYQYLSYRVLNRGTGLNEERNFKDNFLQQLIFHEYILTYTGHYGAEKEDSLLQYQTEYILSGMDTDVENLKGVAYQLLLIRAAANMVHLVSDGEKMAAAEALAGTLATLILLPEIAPLFQTVIVLTWGIAESIYDVRQLLAGGRIPLLKDASDWHYSLEGIFDFSVGTGGTEAQEGLSYKDYLRILLCLQDKKQTTYRLMDIMEMDIRQTPGNGYFRMDGCIDSVTAVIQYSSEDGEEYSITRSYGY